MVDHYNSPEVAVSTYDLSINLHDANSPVIKIDFEGTILYANKAALGIIQEWGCAASRKLPVNLLQKHPELLDRQANVETELVASNKSFKFHVIAFYEAGYTGLYGTDLTTISK